VYNDDMPGLENIRIVVADDHPIVREGLIKILESETDIEIIAQVGSGAEVISFVNQHKPDILLLDIEMPGMNGVEVIHKLKDAGNTVRVIIFTAFNTDERIVSAVKARARGYLLKGAPRDEIITVVRTVNKGGSSLQADVASKLMHQMRRGGEQLTPRELDVLHLLSKGLTNKGIASNLYISERTVKFHLSSVFNKLDVESRTEAVTTAVRKGLISI